MKRFLLILAILSCVLSSSANEPGRLGVQSGFLFPYTLDATVGYEMPVGSGKAIDIFGELGDHWQKPVCHMFWKGYFWDGGINYKQRIKQYKNGSLRIFGGGHVGAVHKNTFFGIRAGFEYNYVFINNWVFTATQLNQVNFRRGDTFRNGIMVGIKIPL